MPVRARDFRCGKRTDGIRLSPNLIPRRGPCPQRLKRRIAGSAMPSSGRAWPERPVSHETCPSSSKVPDNSSLHDVSEQAPRPWRARCNFIHSTSSLQRSLIWLRQAKLKAKRGGANPHRAGARAPSTCKPKDVWRQQIADLVEPDGIEPTTSCLQSRRSPN